MTSSNLGQNQIVPAARPVDAFIRPMQRNVAAPVQPQMMPNPSGIRLIGQGNGGSVQGSNQFEELAQALAPFSRGLVQLAGAGLELYASDQYQRGQSEAARALVQANQQMLASGASYASENRKLNQADPVAALMMDRVNPFRDAGRQNRLSRAAGQAIIPEVLRGFNNTPGVADIEEGSPVLKQLSAGAVEGVLKRFGINESSPGFIEHVLPQIGQAEQKLYERHLELRTKQLKEYAWRETANGMAEILRNARVTGSVEWTEFDPNTGQEVKAVAEAGQSKAMWEQGVKRLFTRELNRLANETGITGEPTELKRKAVVQLAQVARMSGDTELLRLLGDAEFGGPADRTGRRLTVADVVGVEMFEEGAKIGQLIWQDRQRQVEQGIETYQSRLAELVYSLPDGPEKGRRIEALNKEFTAMGIPLGKLMEAAKSTTATLEAVAGRSYDPSGMDALLQDMQGRVGPLWNAKRADQEFENMLRNAVAPAERAEYRRRYADIRRTQEKEKDDAPQHLTRPIIDGKIKANLRRAYPNDITEAALRNTDITGFMAWGDADVARSAQLQHSAYTKHVLTRLNEAAAKKGQRLTQAEVIEVTTRAVEEYGNKDKEGFKRLFPGSDESDEPSVGGRARPPRAGGAGPGGTGSAALAPVVYPSGQLDNVPNRSQRLKSGETVLALPSLQEELTRVMNGDPPSPAVVRAARDAGFGNNVGRWLLREASGYPNFIIPAPARKQLMRSSSDAQGFTDSIQTAAATQNQPISYFANAILNAITGSGPAMAATRPPGGWGGDGRPFGGSPGRFERPESVVFERPGPRNQPGVDYWFASGRFPAVLNGRVKDIGREPGYGNYVVIESIDPRNGKSVDVLYGHLPDNGIYVRRGQTVNAGQIIGKQGGTGNVRSADGTIASVDFFAPRPAGSRDMTPYQDFDGLRRHVTRQLQGGGGGEATTTRRGGGMTGIATYYTGSGGSDGVAGGPTANGERYNPRAMTAAVQLSLRGKFLNKWLVVEDLDTGKSVRVWANDVGQMGGSERSVNSSDPRIIDLSPAAFTRLFGGTGRGTGRIRVRIDSNQRRS